jgi:hypothetical protein
MSEPAQQQIEKGLTDGTFTPVRYVSVEVSSRLSTLFQDQVHMIWHHVVSPQFHVRLTRLLPRKIPRNLLIAVFKEDRFSTIATLRHGVRETGYYHAGQTRHERKLTTEGVGIMSTHYRADEVGCATGRPHLSTSIPHLSHVEPPQRT